MLSGIIRSQITKFLVIRLCLFYISFFNSQIRQLKMAMRYMMSTEKVRNSQKRMKKFRMG